jgi:hypothetical protein
MLSKKRIQDFRNPFLISSLLIIWMNRILTFVIFPAPVITPDSASYLPPENLDFSHFSILGNSVRPWPTTLLYAVTGTTFLVLFQLILSGLSVTLLILTIHRDLPLHRTNNFITLLVSLFLSTTTFLSWDTLANAQSISNSLGLIIFTLFLKIMFSHSNKILITLFMLVAIAYIAQRPVNTVLILGYFSLFLKFRLGSYRKFAVLSIIGVLIFTVAGSFHQDKAWKASYSGFAIMGHLNNVSPIAQEFSMYLKKNEIPICVIESKLSALDESDNLYCKDGTNWVRMNAKKIYFNFLITHPLAIIKLVQYSFLGAFSDSAQKYGNAVSVLPRTIDSLLLGERDPKVSVIELDNAKNAYYLFIPGFLLLVFAPIFGVLSLIGRKRRSKTPSELLLVSLFYLLVLNLLVIILISPLVSAEWTRILAPYGYLSELFCILMLALGTENILSLKSEIEDHTSHSEE